MLFAWSYKWPSCEQIKSEPKLKDNIVNILVHVSENGKKPFFLIQTFEPTWFTIMTG